MKNTARLLLAASIPALALLGGVPFAAYSPLVSAARAAEPAGTNVKIYLKDGRVVEGVLIEETPTAIRVKVKMTVGMVETTYQRSEVEKMEVVKAGADPVQPAKTEAGKPTVGAVAKPEKIDTSNWTKTKGLAFDRPLAPGAYFPDDAPVRIYTTTLTGEWGTDVSPTPLHDVIQDAKKNKADIIILQMNVTLRDRGGSEIAGDQMGQFDGYGKTEELDPIITENIENDPTWVNKPKIVFWVKRAMGGAAFLPFVSPYIYYHSDGKQGGIGGLDFYFKGANKRFIEKQLSLRIGHAEGMCITGGYEPKLINAMGRHTTVLSVSFIGGKPVYFDDESGEMLLTDDSIEENHDPDPFSPDANDVLTLTAEIAYKLGVSRGTADTLDDLLFEMGIPRNAVKIEAKGEKIWKDWRQAVADAKDEIGRLQRKYREIEVGGDWEARKKARNQQISALNELKKLLRRYAEVFDPEGKEISEIDTIIEQINQEQRLDKRR